MGATEPTSPAISNGTSNVVSNGAANGTTSGMSNVTTSARGDATWEWDSALGQWVDVSDRSSEPRRRGTGAAAAGEGDL